VTLIKLLIYEIFPIINYEFEFLMLERFYYMFVLWSFNRPSMSINYIGFKAYYRVSFFQMLNVFVFWRLVSHYNLLFLTNDKVLNYGIFIGVAILVTNYIFLYRKRKEIMIKIESLSSKRKRIEKIIFVSYVFVSTILFAVILSNRF